MDRINRTINRVSDNVDLDVNIDWRKQILIVGGITGALLGLASAYFYIRAADEANNEGEAPTAPEPGDAVKLGLSLLTIVRTIAEWGSRGSM
jgi:hypothetical protein